MHYTFRISGLLLAISLTSCTTPQVIQYKNTNPSSADAHFTFKSELDTHTYFSVNEHPVEKCADFKPIGYVLNADSIFLYDKPNKEIKIKMPSGNPIALHGYHKFSNPGMKSYCFPPRQIFTPEAAGIYEIKMGFRSEKGTDGVCFLKVSKVSADGIKTPTQTQKFGYCDTKTNTLTKK